MSDSPNILKCNHCKRPVSKHAMPEHIQGCLNKKQEKQRKKKEAKDARDAAARKEKNSQQADSDDEGGEDGSGKKVAAGKNGGGGLLASKKRKAVDEAEEGGAPTKKKKKKDATASDPKTGKAARPKAPVDVEKQCGVELPQGGQCARSLTCKSHSMGAKRAVPGRSAPYDKLLMEYQRKNQAKLQKAAFDARAPEAEDEGLEGEGGAGGQVDWEEERDAVMGAIARSFGGRPLFQPTMVPLRRRYDYNRIRGMLGSALGGGRSDGLFGNGVTGGGFFGPATTNANTTNAPTVDADGVVHARKGSVLPGARSMMAPAAAGSRKGSVASAVAV